MLLALILSHSAALSSAPGLGGLGPQTAPPWLAMRRQAAIAYLLFASPPRIARYNMESEAWLPDITLGGTPTALAVDGAGLYVACGSRIVRYNLDVNSSELVDRLIREKGVLIVPGDHFGLDHHLRISFGLPHEYLRAGLDRIHQLVSELQEVAP